MRQFVLSCAVVFSAMAVVRLPAAEKACHCLDKSFTGILMLADTEDQTLKVMRWNMFNHDFKVDAACAFAVPSGTNNSFQALRIGQKVTVWYRNEHGTNIADRVEQIPIAFEGRVIVIDPIAHLLLVRNTGLDKPFTILPGCPVTSLDHHPVTLGDIHVNDHVTVTYEIPNQIPTARQIAHTSIQFAGNVTMVDVTNHMVKATATFESHKFQVSTNCMFAITGQPGAHLDDLEANEKLIFSYDEVNGSDVVNRIASPEPDGVARSDH
jgi:hypothetical protein